MTFLKTLWRWKVLSYRLAHKLSFPEIAFANFYNKARRLINEGYILDKTAGNMGFDVLHLTKKGFDFIKYDLGELKEMRFNAQSVPHDYWATAFQLGSFIHDKNGKVQFFTEQEVQCTDESLFPTWMPKSKEHIPDGLTAIKKGDVEKRFAIEVELNLKPPIRYDRAAYYFDADESKIDVVLWLCASVAIAQAIFNRLIKANLRRFDIHHFFLTEDFKHLGWQSASRSGQHKGKTLKEIYLLSGYEGPMEVLLRSWEGEDSKIFFSNQKSPWKKRV